MPTMYIGTTQMKNRIWKLTKRCSHVAVLALIVASLIATAAYPSVTVRIPVTRPVETSSVGDQSQILPGQPAPAESTDKMGTGRKQQAAPCLIAVAPSIVKTDSGNQNNSSSNINHSIPNSSIIEQPDYPEPIALECVSTLVASRFTLVGAKPSGTM